MSDHHRQFQGDLAGNGNGAGGGRRGARPADRQAHPGALRLPRVTAEDGPQRSRRLPAAAGRNRAGAARSDHAGDERRGGAAPVAGDQSPRCGCCSPAATTKWKPSSASPAKDWPASFRSLTRRRRWRRRSRKSSIAKLFQDASGKCLVRFHEVGRFMQAKLGYPLIPGISPLVKSLNRSFS